MAIVGTTLNTNTVEGSEGTQPLTQYDPVLSAQEEQGSQELVTPAPARTQRSSMTRVVRTPIPSPSKRLLPSQRPENQFHGLIASALDPEKQGRRVNLD